MSSTGCSGLKCQTTNVFLAATLLWVSILRLFSAYVGFCWAALGLCSLPYLETILYFVGLLGPVLAHIETVLGRLYVGPPWVVAGLAAPSFWVHVGPSWACVGTMLCDIGLSCWFYWVVLGLCWRVLGSCRVVLGYVGPSWSYVGPSWALCWAFLGSMLAYLGAMLHRLLAPT